MSRRKWSLGPWGSKRPGSRRKDRRRPGKGSRPSKVNTGEGQINYSKVCLFYSIPSDWIAV